MLTNSNSKSPQHFLKSYSSESLDKISLVPDKTATFSKFMSTYSCSSEKEFKSLMLIEDGVEQLIKSNSGKISELIKKRKSLLVILRFLRSLERITNSSFLLIQKKIFSALSETNKVIAKVKNDNCNLNKPVLPIDMLLQQMLLPQILSREKDQLR